MEVGGVFREYLMNIFFFFRDLFLLMDFLNVDILLLLVLK